MATSTIEEYKWIIMDGTADPAWIGNNDISFLLKQTVKTLIPRHAFVCKHKCVGLLLNRYNRLALGTHFNPVTNN